MEVIIPPPIAAPPGIEEPASAPVCSIHVPQCTTLGDCVDRLKEDLASQTLESHRLRLDNERLHAENIKTPDAQQEIAILRTVNSAAAIDVSDSRRELTAPQQELLKLQKDLATANKHIISSDKTLQDTQQKLLKAQSDLHTANERIETQRETIRALEGASAHLNELATVRNELRDATIELQRRKDAFDFANRNAWHWSDEAAQQHAQIAQLRDSMAHLHARVIERDRQIAQLQFERAPRDESTAQAQAQAAELLRHMIAEREYREGSRRLYFPQDNSGGEL